jgi:ribokinase
VGGDAFGAAMLKDLEGDGLDVSGVKIVEKETTGTATILVEEESGENRILVTPGANASLRTEDELLRRNEVEEVVIFQLETPIDVVCENIRRAAAKGSQVRSLQYAVAESIEYQLACTGHIESCSCCETAR